MNASIIESIAKDPPTGSSSAEHGRMESPRNHGIIARRKGKSTYDLSREGFRRLFEDREFRTPLELGLKIVDCYAIIYIQYRIDHAALQLAV